MAKNNCVPRNEDERVAPLRHHSRGGDVRRNNGNFTRGSQLIGHRLFMWKSGALIPVYIWFAPFVVAFWSHLYTTLGAGDLQLIILRIGASLNSLFGANELRLINLTVERYLFFHSLSNHGLIRVHIASQTTSKCLDHSCTQRRTSIIAFAQRHQLGTQPVAKIKRGRAAVPNQGPCPPPGISRLGDELENQNGIARS